MLVVAATYSYCCCCCITDSIVAESTVTANTVAAATASAAVLADSTVVAVAANITSQDNQFMTTQYRDYKLVTFGRVRVLFRGLKILRPFLQFGVFTLAFYICLTRVSDYKHHPADVVAGGIVGIFFATINLLVLLDLFRRPRVFKFESTEELDHKSSDDQLLMKQMTVEEKDGGGGEGLDKIMIKHK